ncbi:hypothetical protein PP724_22860 [Ralstonia solanacearum]|uniref:hypothetical protein n=1 Tax=Ralstonia solanacearum TaxID=305 RepID=UPI001FF96EB4|nr:hypothetical protein [Ralstonia solanacearum]MDC6237008.1 hypothetical protein [Ralstonia solanacearum]MDD7810559.1 hypothetical protein [Ralstonia solanacearum]
MAALILTTHPLANLPLDSDLALTLELEDPLLMKLQRLQELIDVSPQGEARAYLVGVLDTRRTIAACMGRPV